MNTLAVKIANYFNDYVKNPKNRSYKRFQNNLSFNDIILL